MVAEIMAFPVEWIR